MIHKLKNIRNIILGTPTGKTLDVVITRNVRLTLPNGTNTDGLTGETYTLAADEARDLVNCQAAKIVGEDELREAKAASLTALLPPVREVQPLPARWENLPPAFAAWHDINQKALVVLGRRDDIEAELIRRITPAQQNSFNGINQLSYEHRHTVMVNLGKGERFSPEEHAAQVYLRDALQRASDAANDWLEMHREALFSARVACSDEVIAVNGELSRTCKQLGETGLAIFAVRVAALGLGESRVKNLFDQSADFFKYHVPAQAPALQDMKMLWHIDEGRDQRFYIEQSPIALAQHWLEWTARNVELTGLLKTAKAELAKAQKASMPAGLPA